MLSNSIPMRRREAVAAIAAAFAGALPTVASAQAGTLKLIVPNGAGSGVDVIARSAQPVLAKVLGANVVVENQPAAGGVIGLQALARSAPDGNTLAFVSNNVVILPSVLKAMPVDMATDFTPISIIGAGVLVLVVNPTNVAASSHREFAALLKSKPGVLNYASSGNGTNLHLAAELYLDRIGASAKHIPYKGAGPMVADLMGGQVDFAVAGLPAVLSQIRGGALKAIGVFSPKRTTAAPEVPTIAEQGLDNFAEEAWIAVIGPKGLGAANVKKLHEAVVAAYNDPAVKETMLKQGVMLNVTGPEEAQTVFRRELVKYAAVVKKVGLEPQ
jgi:tripartite-type tricarboxylate transporter receptor subunit TctC